MCWSYIGLIAALAAESATHFVMPLVAAELSARGLWGTFWGLVAFASFAVVGVGARLVKTRLPASLEATPEAMRAERRALEAEASS